MAVAIAEQHGANQRAWRDLTKWRLLVGLAFAPVLPIALGALILLMFGADFALLPLSWVLAAAETWSMLIGSAYLLMARFRGGIRRAHCLLLGAFLAFSLPTAAYLASTVIDWNSGKAPPREADEGLDFDDDFHGPSDGGLVFILGLVLLPFGTLGGWVFWRVGVYPARPKFIDAAAVFD